MEAAFILAMQKEGSTAKIVEVDHTPRRLIAALSSPEGGTSSPNVRRRYILARARQAQSA